ncbi:hypothetical protein, partial [Shewanella nanhaiensis]
NLGLDHLLTYTTNSTPELAINSIRAFIAHSTSVCLSVHTDYLFLLERVARLVGDACSLKIWKADSINLTINAK